MKPILSIPLFTLAVGLAMAWPAPSHAANWKHPYSNVDHSNDAGNNTGDSQVDSLNAAQLDENYRGPWHYSNGQPAGTMPGGTMPGGGAYGTPRPAPGYTPPRY